MIGKIGYSVKTGHEQGVITVDMGEKWQIKTPIGTFIEISKDLVTTDSSHAEKTRQTRTDAGTAVSVDDGNGVVFDILCGIDIFLGIVFIISGLIGMSLFWPRGEIYSTRFAAGVTSVGYTMSFTALFSGLISGLIFFNFAALLKKK